MARIDTIFFLRGGPARRERTCTLVALFAMLIVVLGAQSAQAQPLTGPPPVFTSVDGNGVDLVSGAFNYNSTDITIGQPGQGGLAFTRTYIGTGWRHDFIGTIEQSASTFTVSVGGSSETFNKFGSFFSSNQARGARLTYDSGAGIYTYTTASGAVALFDTALAGSGMPYDAIARVTTLTLPTGEQTTFHYRAEVVQSTTIRRLQSVTNNFGYQLHFEYVLNSMSTLADVPQWQTLSGVTAVNNAVAYCDPTAVSCGLSGWPSVGYAVSGSYETITDELGNQTRITYSGTSIVAIRRPTSPGADNVTIAYSSGRVSSVSNGTGTWAYSYVDVSGVRTTTMTDPLSHTRVVTTNLSIGRPATDTDGENRSTSYWYDTYNRVERVIQPEGNYVEFAYDARGNATQTTNVPKSGSGLSNIVTTSDFVATCSNVVTCNQPQSTTDGRGFRTDFAYDATHGGITSVTRPAPSGAAPVGSGTRPQTRFAYEQHSARYYTAPSTLSTGPAVWVLTGVSACATGSSCTGTSDETVTAITYPSSSVANNLSPTSISSGAGDGSLTATNALTYDDIGNVVAIDGPLSSSADTTTFRYDAARQLIGTAGPDPDGGAALKHRAQRITYNADRQITSTEYGTINTSTGWGTFASLEQVTTAYDFVGRPVRAEQVANGSTHAVQQMSYDAANRLECAATRMNASVFGSLPSSACVLSSQGNFGPDRIAHLNYNSANQAIRATSGYGTPSALDEWTVTYTANGLTGTLADASGNLTTYVYDGFDRLRQTRYPLSGGGGSSTTDFEQYSYNANSDVTEVRRRDATTIALSLDNLRRVSFADASTNGQDITRTYDNFGRLLTASSGQTITLTYDQLSRQASEQHSVLGTVSYQYDLAGHRTRVTWPDAFYAEYVFNVADDLTQIRENGATSGPGLLAQYSYDDLGRRVSLIRGNGATTGYDYDSAQRLNEIAHDLVGSSGDETITLQYNPAFQVTSREGSNSNYQWTPQSPGTVSYSVNGLNQYANVGGASQTYDTRGNLTTGSLGYDIRNNLTAGPNSAVFAFDPLVRLYQSQSASISATRFLYENARLIAEYDTSGVLLRRYVQGVGVDEPVVWYEGSGTSDRRWFVQDQAGSVIAISDGAGAAASINSYDEFGSPASTNVGRFQYTGQTWLSEVGQYHYRARTYASGFGRFLQVDPMLTDGGINIYSYVGNDPVNRVDPSGLAWWEGDNLCWIVYRATLVQDQNGVFQYSARDTQTVCAQMSESAARSYVDSFGGLGAMDPLPSDHPICQRFNSEVARTASYAGNRPNSWRWNSTEALSFDLARAQLNAETAFYLNRMLTGGTLGSGIASVQRNTPWPRATGLFSLGTGIAAELAAMDQAIKDDYIEALTARLDQLQYCGGG